MKESITAFVLITAYLVVVTTASIAAGKLAEFLLDKCASRIEARIKNHV